jgi:hypothetical protein
LVLCRTHLLDFFLSVSLQHVKSIFRSVPVEMPIAVDTLRVQIFLDEQNGLTTAWDEMASVHLFIVISLPACDAPAITLLVRGFHANSLLQILCY